MTNGAWNTLAAELIKLRTLPAALITICVTVLAAAAFAAALEAAPFDRSLTVAEATLGSVEYVQAGFIVLGVLSVASEYAGSQARTTLTSVPGRLLLMTGKAGAYLLTATATALLTVTASCAGAWLAASTQGTVAVGGVDTGQGAVGGAEVVAGPAGGDLAALARAAVYLVLIGLLAQAVAALLRDVIASLATVLALVLVVPRFLAGVTSLADYLPGAAGARLYQAGPGLTPVEGGLVLAAWLTLALTAATISFTKRDA
ncbi:ABC transporter permease [Nonomuraea sp. NPDC050643]|uniref:ABC transporter permease n=1 Tax=Nonomuraea sp. NPDC050643 TaxID=3155660 RepID=UPI0033F6663B